MLVFRTNATGAANGDDIYWASRSSTASDFSNVVPLAKINTSFSEVQPFLTPDGMEVYFSGNGTGDYDIYRAVATAPGTFPTPSAVKEVNASGAPDQNPTVSADDLTMVFSSGRFGGQGGQDVWITKRPNKTSAFGPPVNLSEVNSGANDYPSWISADGCRLYMYSDRSGTLHVYSSSRPQ